MKIDQWICDVKGCGAKTRDPIKEKWFELRTGVMNMGEICPKHFDGSTLDVRAHEERRKELDKPAARAH